MACSGTNMSIHTHHRETKACILLHEKNFWSKGRQQLNHSNKADQSSCKLQVTSLEWHIYYLFDTFYGWRKFNVSLFFFPETKTCFSVSDVFLIWATYNKVNKGQPFFSVKNSHNLDVCKTQVGVWKLFHDYKYLEAPLSVCWCHISQHRN